MSNTRFATAIHIMTLLAKYSDEWLTSEWIAGSLNSNPAMIRKEIGVLKSAGLIASRKGKEGGSMLAKKAEEISMGDIFAAVKNTEVLGRKNSNPNPKCPVGRDINVQLEQLFTETDSMVNSFLNKKLLHDFAETFR
ncbi:Rrf2 family transcriptional regulator [Chryseobacterium sp. Leaf180]|uniref:Rrf2 family transcriptional regulator n=1 Tax=Chryseobacterium sp. Leaf180 TaxID=1736289 RepID=UPI00070237AA|nr:Rrf2 family transcriptional regulator [Chryseobacterium sp. Leaf180]KQR92697.1 Rrf2 family transcriptional regulator [Chryseobacterium sp. Leaf180]